MSVQVGSVEVTAHAIRRWRERKRDRRRDGPIAREIAASVLAAVEAGRQRNHKLPAFGLVGRTRALEHASDRFVWDEDEQLAWIVSRREIRDESGEQLRVVTTLSRTGGTKVPRR